MPKYSVKIPIERQRFVEGRLDIPEQYAGPRRTAVIMAHGAANDMNEPLLRHLAKGLCRAGYAALRFNFPYRTEGRQRPDSQRVLESAWLETEKWLRNQKDFPMERVVLGGKSMGARVVAQLAGAGRIEAEGFAFWGYPCIRPGGKTSCGTAISTTFRTPCCSLRARGTRFATCRFYRVSLPAWAIRPRWKLWRMATIPFGFRSPRKPPSRMSIILF